MSRESILLTAGGVVLLLVLMILGYWGYTEFVALPPITVVPTLAPFDESKWVNPYYSTELEGASELRIRYLDPVTLDTYRRPERVTGRQLWEFLNAMNASILAGSYRAECPDHVRMTFVRADGSRFMLRACLDGVVFLRGVPGAVNEELPMPTRFSQVILPYLPEEWRNLLDIP